ncbi:hypothetical protein LU631_14865 [Erwinia tracheiphila]|nr:hypothetical protein [Erwinia tracheiphila]UIA85867.1 hypothetical protein LU604_11790 [Erwinia tracheiphila]UIA86304.1 hypothetical protein LU631_14865 [Erwinia tracheiphila]UIA94388.1 hypothetical protein LU632_11360 [Erwinia tracheiphila]UIA94622.1 hypothetical protein LU633_13075 [Erwinia tracheiphila]
MDEKQSQALANELAKILAQAEPPLAFQTSLTRRRLTARSASGSVLFLRV